MKDSLTGGPPPQGGSSAHDETPAHTVTRCLHAIRAGDAAAREALWSCIHQELRALAHKHISKEKPGHILQPTALVHEAYLKLMGQSDGSFESRKHFFGAAAEAMRQILVDDARKNSTAKRGGRRPVTPGPSSRLSRAEDWHDAAESAVGRPAENCACVDGVPCAACADNFERDRHGSAVEARGRRELSDQFSPDDDVRHAGALNFDRLDLLALDEALEQLEKENPNGAAVVKHRFFLGLTVDQTAEVLGVCKRTVNSHWEATRGWLYAWLSRE